ncbi:MAG: hypothetical protein KatS3mg102_1765 [Planctomycetota bacterium]|nr:MAG: hypothetical protein KatS3mg102_1765 [Planctomycetota bacterium]
MAIKGERVGPFRLERLLGRGLEGEVWKARGEPGAEAVAVKLYLEPAWAEALRESGPPPAPPAHDNLCRRLGFDLEGQPPWAAWTLHEGTTLEAVLAGEHLVPLRFALPVVLQIARGLEALHAAGEAHRDLRPGNVLLDAAGRLRLADPQSPGYSMRVLARVLRGKQRSEREQAHAARLAPYVAPEVARGQPAGAASDMYGFGVMVYTMLCGRRPEGIEVRYPSAVDGRIPKILDEVVLACLERRTRARLPDAIGLGRRLVAGLERARFRLDLSREPEAWVQSTPWRPRPQPARRSAAADAEVGAETGAFRAMLERLAEPRAPGG